MRVEQDGREIEIEGAFQHVEELLAPLLLAPGEGKEPRVVVRLELDGERVSDEALADLSAIGLVSTQQVRFWTASVREVALQGLASAGAYADRVRLALCETADLMRADRPEVANEHFAEAIDGMSVLFFTLEAASQQLGAVAEPVQTIGAEIQPWLDAVLKAQEAQDWVRVADYLEYEIAPILERAPDQIDAARRQGGIA